LKSFQWNSQVGCHRNIAPRTTHTITPRDIKILTRSEFNILFMIPHEIVIRRSAYEQHGGWPTLWF
jgi:hypothetical protein